MMKNSASFGLCTLMVAATVLLGQAEPDSIIYPRMIESLPLNAPDQLWRSLFSARIEKSPKETSEFIKLPNAWVESKKLNELKKLPEWEPKDCWWGAIIEIHAPNDYIIWQEEEEHERMLVKNYLQMRQEKCKGYFEDKFGQLFDERFGPTLPPDETLKILKDIQYLDPSLDKQIAELISLDMPFKYQGGYNISDSSPTMLNGKSSVAIENYKKDRLAKVGPFFEALQTRLKFQRIRAFLFEERKDIHDQLEMIYSELERLSGKNSYNLSLDDVDKLVHDYFEVNKNVKPRKWHNGFLRRNQKQWELSDPRFKRPCNDLIGRFNEKEFQSLRTVNLLGLRTHSVGQGWMSIFIACRYIVGQTSA